MTHLTSEKNNQYFNKSDKKIVSLVLYLYTISPLFRKSCQYIARKSKVFSKSQGVIIMLRASQYQNCLAIFVAWIKFLVIPKTWLRGRMTLRL